MTLRKNYSKTCLYCGAAFRSNRNTAEYCCSQHGSLYRAQRLKEKWERDNNIISENKSIHMAENNLKAQLNVTISLMEQESWRQAQRLSKLKEEYNNALLNAYNDNIVPKDNFWSRLIPEIVIRERYFYFGPLSESRRIIIGDFLIKPLISKSYKIKPVELLTTEELEEVRWIFNQGK
mgnify:CR=1 FL=1